MSDAVFVAPGDNTIMTRWHTAACVVVLAVFVCLVGDADWWVRAAPVALQAPCSYDALSWAQQTRIDGGPTAQHAEVTSPQCPPRTTNIVHSSLLS